MRTDPARHLFRGSDTDPGLSFFLSRVRAGSTLPGSATLLFTKQCRTRACVNIAQKLIQHAAYSDAAPVAWIIFHMQPLAGISGKKTSVDERTN